MARSPGRSCGPTSARAGTGDAWMSWPALGPGVGLIASPRAAPPDQGRGGLARRGQRRQQRVATAGGLRPERPRTRPALARQRQPRTPPARRPRPRGRPLRLSAPGRPALGGGDRGRCPALPVAAEPSLQGADRRHPRRASSSCAGSIAPRDSSSPARCPSARSRRPPASAASSTSRTDSAPPRAPAPPPGGVAPPVITRPGRQRHTNRAVEPTIRMTSGPSPRTRDADGRRMRA